MNIIVLGVSGVGKTTIGEQLARRLGFNFADADQYHSPENVKKMSAGIPLTDADRWPWLDCLHDLLRDSLANNEDLVLACSALKQIYRDRLDNDVPVTWVYLKGTPEVIRKRMEERHGHFAHENLLVSQLATLEEPKDAITVDADKSVDEIVHDVISKLPKATSAS
jgi:gluconokinase